MSEEWCDIVWSEGMFLTPHHLQFWDRHADAVRWSMLDAASPVPTWGFKELEVATEPLTDFRFALSRLKAIMPGGVFLAHPGNLDLPSRDFKEFLADSRQDVMVWLGVPEIRQDQPNLIRPEDKQAAVKPPRHALSQVELLDENTGQLARQIEIKRLQGRLFFGDEDRAGFITLPLARLRRVAGEAAVALDERYVPPLLGIGAWRPFHLALKDLASRLTAAHRSLGEGFADRDIAELLSLPRGPEVALKLLATAPASLVVHQMVQAGRTPPFLVYLELLRLFGAIGVFKGAENVEAPPEYDHEDLGGCFGRLREQLNLLLGRLGAAAYIQRGFIARRGRLEVDMEADWVTGRRQIYLAVASDEEMDRVAARLTGIKLCSPKDFAEVVQRRLGGLGVNWLRQPPAALPPKRYSLFGQISASGPMWGGVQEELTMALGGVEGLPYRFDMIVV